MNILFLTLALTCFVSVHSASWTYDDPAWGHHFPSCDGKIQSPINIIPAQTKYSSALVPFKLKNYDADMKFEIVNNGHTIQLNIPRKDLIASGGGLPGTFRALQFHFHWSENKVTEGSEHRIDNSAFPLELHIVHMNTDYSNVTEALKHPDGLAVLGFFFKEGSSNKGLAKFIKKIPQNEGKAESESFSISDLIESDDDMARFYRYKGSLTTPPCSQAVVWTLFSKFLSADKAQLKAFWDVKDSKGKKLFNFRSPQKLNGRIVLASFESSGMMTTAISVLVLVSVFISTNLW